jgi:hypothetical protein
LTERQTDRKRLKERRIDIILEREKDIEEEGERDFEGEKSGHNY